MKKFVIIDGNAIIHRSYHALPKSLRAKDGRLTNAVHGFTGILLGIIDVEQPDYLATAWDMKGPTFRDEMLSDYKGTRAKTDDELIAQFGLTYAVLDALKIPMYKKEGLEADDYLGIVAKEVETIGDIEMVIVTSDKDALQLVRDNVTVVTPISGYKKVVRYDKNKVKEKMGVWPNQVADYKGLCGDNSDNIKGVPGIGPKSATKLLDSFGSVDGIYECIDQVEPERIRKLLIEHEEDARVSKAVATILQEDGDLGFRLEDSALHDFNIEDVRRIFDELSFNTHMRRVEAFNKRMDERRAAELQGELF